MVRCPEKHRRNERERQRVHQVNEMFTRLRNSVRLSADRRLSKADTLRFAIQYIDHLKKMLDNGKLQMTDFHFTPSSAAPSPSFPPYPTYSHHSFENLKTEAK